MSGGVLITGAGGFIGRHLSPSIEAAGRQVTGLTHRDADMTDAGELLKHARPAGTLIHLAFETSKVRREERPAESRRLATAGTANALALAAACGVNHFILASSGKVYGEPERLPTGEDHPTAPTTFLGELKLMQEDIVKNATRGGAGFGSTSLRLFNVYGAGAPEGFLFSRLLAAFRNSGPLILGELDHLRDWIHIRDVCAAFTTAVQRPADPGEFRPLNVGSGRSASVRELIDILASISGKRPPARQSPGLLRPDEPAEERADCRRLETLGWRARVDLERGIRLSWER